MGAVPAAVIPVSDRAAGEVRSSRHVEVWVVSVDPAVDDRDVQVDHSTITGDSGRGIPVRLDPVDARGHLLPDLRRVGEDLFQLNGRHPRIPAERLESAGRHAAREAEHRCAEAVTGRYAHLGGHLERPGLVRRVPAWREGRVEDDEHLGRLRTYPRKLRTRGLGR